MVPVFTVALVLALFAGIVWLVADGVSSFKGNDNGQTTGEGANLLKRVGAIIKCTRVINDPLPSVGGRSYDFLADIDGDSGTGGFGTPGYGNGLERLVMYRSGDRSTELRVDVWTAPGENPRSEVLTRDLDKNNPQAFWVNCTLESSAKSGGTTNQRSKLSREAGTCKRRSGVGTAHG